MRCLKCVRITTLDVKSKVSIECIRITTLDVKSKMSKIAYMLNL